MTPSRFIIILASLVFSSASAAQTKKRSERAGSNYQLPNYGMAGCGAGTLVFRAGKDNSSGTQLAVAAVNDAAMLISTLAAGVATGGTVVVTYTASPTAALISGPTSAQSSSVALGISNCSDVPSDSDAMLKEQQTYVAVNFEALTKEAAQGTGEHLNAFADILGCGQGAHFERFAKISQTSHGEIFSDADPEQVTFRWIKHSRADQDVAGCLRQ
jgi:hypothetical protein